MTAQRDMLSKAGVISPWVFPYKNGNITSQDNYYKAWARYRKHNGIGVSAPYELRHTFFSLNKTIPLELIKLVGGHSSSFDTYGTYGHEVSGDTKKAAKYIDETLCHYLGENDT